MKYKFTVTITDPHGETRSVELDIIASDKDMAMVRLLSWYDRTDWSLSAVGPIPEERER